MWRMQLRLRFLLLFFCLTFLESATCLAEPITFDAWLEASAKERAEVVEKFINQAQEQDIVILYDGVRQELENLQGQAVTAQDRTWIDHFLAVMQEIQVSSPQRMLEQATAEIDPAVVAGNLKGLRQVFTGNPFPPRAGQRDPNYYIFQDVPEVEIVISPEETSPVAQQLWLAGEKLEGMFNQANLQFMTQTHSAIAEGKQRWVNFMDHVLSDQYPWETLVNGSIWEGTLAQPPEWQLRLLHPVPAMVANVEGEVAFKPRMGVEGLGLRNYSSPKFEPKYGVSLLAILPGDEEERFGYGVLFALKKFSFGGIWQDRERGDDAFALAVGVDLAELFENKGRQLKEKVDKIRNALDTVGNALSQ